jgi:hypothetical protein
MARACQSVSPLRTYRASKPAMSTITPFSNRERIQRARSKFTRS